MELLKSQQHILGERSIAGYPPRPFGIALPDRRHHLFVIGATGLGKTTFLHGSLIQDLATPGVGVAFLDPDGTAAAQLLDYIPPSRTGDVVYFDPEDADHPIGLNLLDTRGDVDEHQVVGEAVSIFKRFWGDSFMARSEDLLANTLAALVEHGGQTLLGALRMLTDAPYRERILAKTTNPVVLGYWRDEFEHYDARYREQMAAPILNKLRRFVTDAPMRNIVGQVKSGFDIEALMNEGKILLARLPVRVSTIIDGNVGHSEHGR